MAISDESQYDPFRKRFVGGVTLGEPAKPGDQHHILVALVRGVSTAWKQVIAYEVTGASVSGPDMAKFATTVIQTLRSVGLIVCAQVTDMGGANKALWCQQGVSVTRTTQETTFLVEGDETPIPALAE